MDDLLNISAKYLAMLTDFAISLVVALIVLVIGLIVIKQIVKMIRRIMTKKEYDPSLQGFLLGLISVILKIVLFIAVIQMIGVQTTSFIAILGAAGLAVGLALSGTLQNFAGGVMLLVFKPFKTGDWIDAQGYSGTVNEIQIFNTILKTPDNKTVIIPNGGLSTGPMVNYSTEPQRRVDWTFGIGYGDDADKAQKVMKDLLSADERVLKDPEPFVEVSALADSSVNFAVRAWVNAPDYWGLYFDMNKRIYQTFAKEGLNIPFPQMDVHVHNA
jgi:small conductance mechanosensitive channel